MKHVLLIEPDKVLADIYMKAIEKSLKYSVDVATGAQQAIMLADGHTPDLVIVEIQLIEHSGIEFLYEFRSYVEWQSIPIIIHSIVPFIEFIDSWQLLRNELGVDTYLYKPHTNLKTFLGNVKEHNLVNV
jgi:DNA-binding response OmpR family regulator